MANQGGPSHFDTRRALSPDGFVYGFSYFNQVKSTTSKRGYSQVLPPIVRLRLLTSVVPEVYRGPDT